MSIAAYKTGESAKESALVAILADHYMRYGLDSQAAHALCMNLGKPEQERIVEKAKALAGRMMAKSAGNGGYDRETELIDRLNDLHSFNLPRSKESIWKNPMFQVYVVVGALFLLVLLYAAIFR